MCVLQEIGKIHDNEQEATDAAIEYFKTADFSTVSYIRISSLLYAGLARRAASGQKRTPNRGMVNDIRMVSTVLPYCDAMFVDNEIRNLLSETAIHAELGFTTSVYSMRNMSEFFEYLDGILKTVSADHRRWLSEVYGDSWTTPSVEMYSVEDK
ncbi:MAG: hypothetical protein IIA66_14045 [Planctomycetes bacterium]|nr:hypothetical protein [Planctomycetota bacterium]